MPRPLRLDLPGIPQHVIQRGNDRQPCFFSDVDHQRYRDDLRELAQREGCAVHAYVLMTNHVHLLMTPATSGSIARLMQSLGRRYVRMSTIATTARAHSGRAATRPAWWTMATTCSTATATSS